MSKNVEKQRIREGADANVCVDRVVRKRDTTSVWDHARGFAKCGRVATELVDGRWLCARHARKEKGS